MNFRLKVYYFVLLICVILACSTFIFTYKVTGKAIGTSKNEEKTEINGNQKYLFYIFRVLISISTSFVFLWIIWIGSLFALTLFWSSERIVAQNIQLKKDKRNVIEFQPPFHKYLSNTKIVLYPDSDFGHYGKRLNNKDGELKIKAELYSVRDERYSLDTAEWETWDSKVVITLYSKEFLLSSEEKYKKIVITSDIDMNLEKISCFQYLTK